MTGYQVSVLGLIGIANDETLFRDLGSGFVVKWQCLCKRIKDIPQR